MHIGNRLFPYPILNHEKLYSQYKDGVFNLKTVGYISEDSNDYILEGLCFETNSVFLKELINENKVKVVCIVESPQTMYRKLFEITETPTDLHIPLFELCGKIMISSVAIATEDIKGLKSDEFLSDYTEYSFDIEKNDILAADDGFINKIDFDSEEDTKKSSIFIIIKDSKIKDELMQVEFDSSLITIKLPESQWDIYDKTKKRSQFEHLYFSIIAIPALTYAIGCLQKSGTDVDQLCIEYKWFNSFKKKFEEVNACELTDDVFDKLNPCTEAQHLLNAPNTKAVDDIFQMLVMPNLGGSEND